MKWIIAFLACIGIAQAQIQQHQISDDGYVRIPLQFPFPYYGQVFTESFMFSNGVVGFINPQWNSWCCTGFDLTNTRGTPFNYAIMPLQTDLLNYSGRFLTEGTPQYQRYKWENISEFGVPQNLNTFGVEIRPSGFIGMYYEQINISPWRQVTIGMTGNTDLGEYTQHYFGSGFQNNVPFSHLTQATGNICLTNPLSSPSCPNYQKAYDDQQCSLNALYSPSCIGYTQAYFEQQCSLNALYDRNCVGYAEAYALANVVTSSSTTVAVAVPQVLVSSTGNVSVETPIVADVAVNEVIVRNNTVSTTVTNTSTTQQIAEVKKEEKKEEKKDEKKEDRKEVKTARAEKIEEIKNQGVAIQAPTIASVDLPKGVDIIDYSFMKIIANMKPIQENRNSARMLNQSDRIHREMVNEQYRR